MPRKKKTNSVQSIIKQLREEGRSNEEFEILVNRLSLEELIWLKLELSATLFVKNKFYGFPLFHSLPKITKDALVKYAYSATATRKEMARFLGVNEYYIQRLINKYIKKK